MKDFVIFNRRRSFLFLNLIQISVIFNRKQNQLEIKSEIYA